MPAQGDQEVTGMKAYEQAIKQLSENIEEMSERWNVDEGGRQLSSLIKTLTSTQAIGLLLANEFSSNDHGF